MNKILYDLLLQAAEYENNTSSPRAMQDLAVYDLLMGSALQLQVQDDGCRSVRALANTRGCGFAIAVFEKLTGISGAGWQMMTRLL